MIKTIHNHERTKEIKLGDQVENKVVRFFVGKLHQNDLVDMDKDKPFTLKDKSHHMANCINQGNYSASFDSLEVC